MIWIWSRCRTLGGGKRWYRALGSHEWQTKAHSAIEGVPHKWDSIELMSSGGSEPDMGNEKDCTSIRFYLWRAGSWIATSVGTLKLGFG